MRILRIGFDCARRRGFGLRCGARAAFAAALLLLLAESTSLPAQKYPPTPRAIPSSQGASSRRILHPALTSAASVHSLTPSQAALHIPVHLRAVCLVCFAGWHGLFVSDGTAGVYVETRNRVLLTSAIRPGTELAIDGVTGAGEFAPIVDQSSLRILGKGIIPPPRRVSVDHLASGAEDGQWIAFDGTVRSAGLRETMLVLSVASGPLKIEVKTTPPEDGKFAQLVNARVRIRGTVGPIFNQRSQLVSVNVYAPSFLSIQVLQPAPADPFALPVRQMKAAFEYSPGAGTEHLVRFRGTVNARWGQILYLNDGFQSASVVSSEVTSLLPGDVVDAVGYPVLGGSTHTIEDAVFKRLGTTALPEATPVAGKEALSGDFEDALVRLDGRLVKQQKASGQVTLVLDAAGSTFQAILPDPPNDQTLAALREGSLVQVTGICVISGFQQSRHFWLPKAFQILMRSPADVKVLSTPSWWTPGHSLTVAVFAFAGILLALVWVVVLRSRVAQQTHLLRESEERFRYLALHDPLTGLATRLLLYDRLDFALESARRRQKFLAILMLDLDSFKPVNDTLGHAAGDAVLRATAARIVAAVRKTDTVARVGGDEFVVVLTDLSEPGEAQNIAEKILRDISAPIVAGGREVLISASIGICNAMAPLGDADELLKDADLALYRAKAMGRNRCVVFSADLHRNDAALTACPC